MTPICEANEVFKAIQRAKVGARAFTTNFFPVQRKIEKWIESADLFGELGNDTTLLLKKDQDFWHLYFSAATVESLQRAIQESPILKTERVVTDLIGDETELNGLVPLLQVIGFRRYASLYRMARLVAINSPIIGVAQKGVVFAERPDLPTILDLMMISLDRYAEQLPARYEIEEAIANRQILVVKRAGVLTGFLFFETYGLTSTIRYWLVDESFRSQGFGSALMRYYFSIHSGVRRFILWVKIDNENAVKKYRYYGFAPDGLFDHVLANGMIPL